MRILAILIFLSLLLACERDNSENPEMVYTGSISDNLMLFTPNPIMAILPYQPDDADSLDLNNDNKFDIKFVKKSVPLYTGFGSMTAIVTSNNLQIALSEINNYPDSLNINVLLNSISSWSSSESLIYELQSFSCSNFHCDNIGNFIDINDKFIGFKLGTKYGWIKIDNSVHGELRIKEYTLIK